MSVEIPKNGTALVKFWAPWCGPCRELNKRLQYIDLDFISVNIDDHPELADKYHLRAVPVLAIMEDGEIVESRTGALKGSDIEVWVEDYYGRQA